MFEDAERFFQRAAGEEKTGKKRRHSLTNRAKNVILKSPGSRGGSGTLNQQSAIAGVIFCRGFLIVKLPAVSGVDVWVLRNRNL